MLTGWHSWPLATKRGLKSGSFWELWGLLEPGDINVAYKKQWLVDIIREKTMRTIFVLLLFRNSVCVCKNLFINADITTLLLIIIRVVYTRVCVPISAEVFIHTWVNNYICIYSSKAHRTIQVRGFGCCADHPQAFWPNLVRRRTPTASWLIRSAVFNFVRFWISL